MRGVTLTESSNPANIGNSSIWLDDSSNPISTLHIPVSFFYPTANQSDLVSAFAESSSFGDQLDVVLAEQPPWDVHAEYHPLKVSIYGMTPARKLLHIGRNRTLKDVLPSITIHDQLATFLVVPKAKRDAFVVQWKANAS